MSNIVDRVFAEVCLDERITDGVFRMDEEEHMNALRDYFIKKGITKEAAIHVTNRMIEGKYPDRQAWRTEDGILVTWPSPKHKAKAMAENPKKYTEKDPAPGTSEPPKGPEKNDTFRKDDFGDKDLPKSDEKDAEGDEEDGKKEPTIFQGDKQLKIEPPRDLKSPEIVPPSPIVSVAPRTPERIAAEKEVVKQIMRTDDTVLSNIADPVYEETCKRQLQELYKKADELGYKEAIKFLTLYVKP